MTPTPNALDYGTNPSILSNRTLLIRAALGFGGGVAVWAMIAWAPLDPDVSIIRGILALAALTLPVTMLGAFGVLPQRTLLAWGLTALAIVVMAGLGRSSWISGGGVPPVPDGAVVLLTCLALAIGHILVRGREEAGTVPRGWPRLFAIAWSDAFRVVLSAAMAGALIGLCALAAGLFDMIGVEIVGETLMQPGCLWPAAGLAFGLGVHFTAERAELSGGARALGLGLLAWLLPVLSALVAAFLITLIFTGLQPLWDTRSATALLMTACIGLIILTNAAVQDEVSESSIPAVLRISARLAGLLLVPLIGIAAIGLFLRINQYGLSPERVHASACIATLAVFAVGQALAALSRIKWIEIFGVANFAGLITALIAILFTLSPPGDPDRLSVLDQTRRLTTGETSADQFDFDLLRFETGKAGLAALEKLAAEPGTTPEAESIRRLATEALARETATPRRLAAPVVTTIAGSAPLPADFLSSSATIQCSTDAPCWAGSVDLDADGQSEVILEQYSSLTAWGRGGDGWRALGEMSSSCDDHWTAFQSGDVTLAPPESGYPDLIAGSVRWRLVPNAETCRG
jgi:hypothetical protein